MPTKSPYRFDQTNVNRPPTIERGAVDEVAELYETMSSHPKTLVSQTSLQRHDDSESSMTIDDLGEKQNE